MASEAMIQNAKAFLLQESPDTKLNLYSHLCDVISKVLEDRTPNAVDVFESLSSQMKSSGFKTGADSLQNDTEASNEVALANIQTKLFEKPGEEAEPEQEDEVEMPLPDLMDIAHYFEQAGIGLGREEMFRVFLALKKLVDTHPLQTVRFWGKVFGTIDNYIIAEVEYREGEEEGEEEEQGEEEEPVKEEEEESEEKEDEDDSPKPDFKPPPVIPREENGTGCNKKTYFVCNEPGGEWIKLPPVTPAQILCARQIKKFFTGNLEAPVISYPPFPGNEINYLRAQIARVSAGTQISPADYFRFEEEDEDESEGEGRDSFIPNVEFEGLRTVELMDPSLSNWVHHVQHILPQGRCTWFNPVQKPEEEFDEEEEEEEREEPDEPVPEVGPPLLTPISEDGEVDSMPAWSTGLTSTLVPQYAAAVLRSNLWPGGFVFGLDKKFENIYIGWGHKYTADNYSPPAPPATQEEYPSGAEVTEVPDPTVDEERALQAVQQEQLEREAEEAEMEDDDEEDD